MTAIFRRPGAVFEQALLREIDDFGIRAYDLVRPPSRFWADTDLPTSLVEPNVDARRVERLPLPSQILAKHADAGEQSLSLTRRSLSRALAWFLLAEDPQRRLDARPVATLAHQASLVRHVLEDPSLQRVLIADEVGLGKTIEAALIVERLLQQQPGLRVLYLAPARLVPNVIREMRLMALPFRQWVAGIASDARLTDPLVVASIHRAIHPSHIETFAKTQWDVIIVDEAHHLTDWAEGGGSPVRKYRLVDELQRGLPPTGRLILLSGTPHQGHADRFENLLRFLQRPGEPLEAISGRVIYRTKEDIRDWNDAPLFPLRRVRDPVVVDLGPDHRAWLEAIHDFFEPDEARARTIDNESRRRAAGWRCGMALQWATSSIQAGLGFLVRQGMRAGCTASEDAMRAALSALRPYRGGPLDEPIDVLWDRIAREIRRQEDDSDVEDIEDELEDVGRWRPNLSRLSTLLIEGVRLLERDPDAKWRVLFERILNDVGDEKVVLFAQPIETVTALASYLQRRTGNEPALIVGGQTDAERNREIDAFWRADGPQFLVSSRAGGEGLNLQVSRRLVHLDVPWNPMELEQRIGRVHRFKSKRTILVDTLVVKDSREVDTYRVAQRKLNEIASTMVAPDRFNELFARVMALVPPDELLGVLGDRPTGPLNSDEARRISELVTRGFEQWKEFHARFAEGTQRIQSLEPGQATWDDVALFLGRVHDVRPADGFAALQFAHTGQEVVESPRPVRVLAINGESYVVDDSAGMPVTSTDGRKALDAGLNVPLFAQALRSASFADRSAGVAVVRSAESRPSGLPTEFAAVFFARQKLRTVGGSIVEAGTSLETFIVAAHDTVPLSRGDAAKLLRWASGAVAVRDPKLTEELAALAATAEERVGASLRRPTEAEIAEGTRYAVFHVLTLFVVQ